MFNQLVEYKINIQNVQLYILAMYNPKIKETILFIIALKRKKAIVIALNSTKEMKHLYSENHNERRKLIN